MNKPLLLSSFSPLVFDNKITVVFYNELSQITLIHQYLIDILKIYHFVKTLF